VHPRKPSKTYKQTMNIITQPENSYGSVHKRQKVNRFSEDLNLRRALNKRIKY